MGIAEVIPGISGGTLALILGVYERLIKAIHSFNISLMRLLMHRRFKDAWAYVDGNYILILFIGMLVSIFTLSSLILLPTVGAFFIFFVKSNNKKYQSSKYIALFISIANFLLSLYLWSVFDKSATEFQYVENREWLSGYVNYKVGVDGISILFILLTTFITPLCILSINNSIKNRLSEFLIAVLIMESFMIGVFCCFKISCLWNHIGKRRCRRGLCSKPGDRKRGWTGLRHDIRHTAD